MGQGATATPPASAAAALDPRILPLVVASAFFMETLDSTIIVTALPRMAGSFHVDVTALSLGLTAYMLATAVVIPASGWLTDRIGPRRLFCAAIAVFTLASALCGLAGGLQAFVAARVLQGVGGALMSPVGRLAILRATGKSDLVRAMNFLTMPGLIGPVLGPPLGGFIATYVGWRWCFLINLPVGVLGVGLALRYMRDGPAVGRRPFDPLGFGLNGTALALVLFGLDRMLHAPLQGAALVLGGIAVGVLALRHASRAEHPLVEAWALRVPSFAVPVLWGGSLFRIAMSAPIFLLPLFLQVGLGLSAFAAGLLVLAHAAGDLLSKPFTTPLLRRFGFKTVLNGTTIAFGLMTAAFALVGRRPSLLPLLALLFLSGLVRSQQMTAQNTLQFADIPPERTTGASTLSSVLQQVIRALGIAVLALVLTGLAAVRGHAGAPAIGDFHLAFLFAGACALAAPLWYARLAPNAGAHVSGQAGIEQAAIGQGAVRPAEVGRRAVSWPGRRR